MVKQIPGTDIVLDALKKHDSYYSWLCSESGISGELAILLFETDFRWVDDIPDDENRGKEALSLRERYAEHLTMNDDEVFTKEIRKNIDLIVKNLLGPPSLFEVLVSLARDMDGMLNLESKPQVPVYFARLMSNAGFDHYDDEDYDHRPEKVMGYWKKLIDRILDRTYSEDGKGGLFPLKHPKSDQRKRSLWNQLNDWVDQEMDETEET